MQSKITRRDPGIATAQLSGDRLREKEKEKRETKKKLLTMRFGEDRDFAGSRVPWIFFFSFCSSGPFLLLLLLLLLFSCF
jgi:hypothetical protein